LSVRLVPTESYLRARDQLRRDARIALAYALERIDCDPDHTLLRRARPDGSVIDYGAERLLIAYRKVDAGTVQLLDVIDLMDAPGWP